MRFLKKFWKMHTMSTNDKNTQMFPSTKDMIESTLLQDFLADPSSWERSTKISYACYYTNYTKGDIHIEIRSFGTLTDGYDTGWLMKPEGQTKLSNHFTTQWMKEDKRQAARVEEARLFRQLSSITKTLTKSVKNV